MTAIQQRVGDRLKAGIRAGGILMTVLAAALAAAPAAAQAPATVPLRPSPRPIGRVSIYTQAVRLAPDDDATATSGDVITAVQLAPRDADAGRFEYGLDLRHRNSSVRPARLSLYDAYVGVRLADGRARVRAGRMWLADLGGLGSMAGGLVEYRPAGAEASAASRLRLGVFGGLEPDPYGLGTIDRVHKLGTYATLEAGGGRRHTAGYVRITQGGLVERSVVTFSNFVPAPRQVFVYQTAEYDLDGPANQGGGRLSYLMINAHASPAERVSLQGQYHRGRSIDARSITDDVLNGRPLRPGALDGLLYESAGGRFVVHLSDDVRVNAGYTRERNNRDSAATGRVTAGASLADLAHSGVDLTVSQSWIRRPNGRYTALYVSAGHRVGTTVYVSADYSTSLSVARFTRSDGITIETSPRTRQVSTSAVVTLSRTLSLTATVDVTRDDTVTDVRLLSGLAMRLR